ncbi:UNKNOWN [Stylonychia lemnae]|uniref:Uncharacterized protein n=1 Tax=Stylonychia lemnae TaxID=5949 RepID=A0A078A4G1_STYLE|nr:UNKNOWN [Stylonychia lemnae]|eukprot:CDW76378.1 UNKNOWN [Stylonychia lemnae]
MKRVLQHINKLHRKRTKKPSKQTGYKNASTKNLSHNEAIFDDRDREINEILVKDRNRKGYGMRGDGTTDTEGNVPLILKVEYLFNEYERHKANIRDTELFQHSQSKIVHRNNMKLIKNGMIDTKNFEVSKELEQKYVHQRKLNASIDVSRQFKLRKFTKNNQQTPTIGMVSLNTSMTVESLVIPGNLKNKGLSSLKLMSKSQQALQSALSHYAFTPDTQEILQVEKLEDFNEFYKRIKPKYVDKINVKKDIDDYVDNKVKQRRKLIGKNLVAQKWTKSLERSSLQKRTPNDQDLKRKLDIQREKDKAECIGYLLADHKKPFRQFSFTIDAVNFPMTSKYGKKKFLDSNLSKPPLPPMLKMNQSQVAPQTSKYIDLKKRIIHACTEYDTQNKKKF